MKLLWGAAGLMVSVVSFCLLLLNERNPKSTVWKSDFVVGSILVPVITGIGLLGSLLIIQYMIAYDAANFSWKEVSMAAAIVAFGLVVIKSMRIKRRLTIYRAQTEASGGTIHRFETPGDHPEPPVVERHAA